MTTSNIRVIKVPDLSVENDILVTEVLGDLPTKMSAIEWLGELIWLNDLWISQKHECFKMALSAIQNHLDNYNYCLLRSTGELPDNRITRHLGLWKNLSRYETSFPEQQLSPEYVIKSPGKLTYFGIQQISIKQPNQLSDEMVEQLWKATMIAKPLSKEFKVEDCVRMGWMEGSYRDAEYLRNNCISICSGSNILFRPFGFFDDREVGVTLFMSPAIYERLSNNL